MREEKPQRMLCIYCREEANVMFKGNSMCWQCLKEKQRTGDL